VVEVHAVLEVELFQQATFAVWAAAAGFRLVIFAVQIVQEGDVRLDRRVGFAALTLYAAAILLVLV
jgi:hypothetical protein